MLAARTQEPHLEDESDVVDVVVPMVNIEELRDRGASRQSLYTQFDPSLDFREQDHVSQ